MRTLNYLLVPCLAFAFAASACTGKKPSEESCQEFVDHFAELLAKGDDEGHKLRKMNLKQRDTVLEICTQQGTAAMITCSKQHDSFEAIAENCK